MPTQCMTTTTSSVTKHFYHALQPHYEQLLNAIHDLPIANERPYYAARLLQRLLFLHFLQHQGLLDNDTHYLSNHLQRMHATHVDGSFYRYFLLPLFYHFGVQPHKISRASSGHLPSLQLALFSPHALEQQPCVLHISDSAFEQLFAFLARYRWHLTNGVPDDDHDLFPAILSYPYEQQSNRRLSGSYYTQDDVTAYIAKNTIIPQLFYTIAQQAPHLFTQHGLLWLLLRANPDHYIQVTLRNATLLPHETTYEYQERNARYQQLHDQIMAQHLLTIDDLITAQLHLPQLALDVLEQLPTLDLAYLFYTTLSRMTILDPTCGSGAFLLAALHTLAPLYHACLTQISLHLTRTPCSHPLYNACHTLLSTVRQYANTAHFVHTTIVRNNLYGVDIMEDALEVCKQRLLLTILAQVTHPHQVIHLPDMQQTLRMGNAFAGSLRTCEDEIVTQSPTDGTPFHWANEFPTIMQRGGFDVIIGNPPYIEYHQSHIKQEPEIPSSGNLYAIAIERSLALCRPGKSYLGLIVPLSLCSSKRFAWVRRLLTQQTASLWLANFEIFPSRLFEDAFQRLSLLLARHHPSTPNTLYVTHIQRWYALERPHLFSLISFTPVQCTIKPSVFPKLASPLQETVLHKLIEHAHHATLADLVSSKPTQHTLYYQEATNYWTKATLRIPFYCKNGIVMTPPHGRLLFFHDSDTAYIVMALMNSSLFYLWFATYADGFHLAHALVKSFPLAKTLLTNNRLVHLAQQLEQDIVAHKRISTRNIKTARNHARCGTSIELEEYAMVHSKPLLDSIDRILAEHYALDNTDLTFILHYDLKYRMGQNATP